MAVKKRHRQKTKKNQITPKKKKSTSVDKCSYRHGQHKHDYPFVSAVQNFFVVLKSLGLNVIVHSVIVVYSAVLFQGLLHLQTCL